MLFRLNQPSFVDHALVAAGQEIQLAPYGYEKGTRRPLSHKPGPHWEPVDDEAKALCSRHGVTYTGEVPDAVEDLSRVAEELARGKEVSLDHDKLGAAIGTAVAEALAPVLGAFASLAAALKPAVDAAPAKPGKAAKPEAEGTGKPE